MNTNKLIRRRMIRGEADCAECIDVTPAMKELRNEYNNFAQEWGEVTKDDIEERFQEQLKMYPRALQYLDKEGLNPELVTEKIKQNAEEDMCLMVGYIVQKKKANKNKRMMLPASNGCNAVRDTTYRALKILKRYRVAKETDRLAHAFHQIMNYVGVVMEEVKLLVPTKIVKTELDSNDDTDTCTEESNKENGDESLDMEDRSARPKLRERTKTPNYTPYRRSRSIKLKTSQSETKKTVKNEEKEEIKADLSLPHMFEERRVKKEIKVENVDDEIDLFDEPIHIVRYPLDFLDTSTDTHNTGEDDNIYREPDDLTEDADSQQQQNVTTEENGDSVNVDRSSIWMHRDRLSDDKVDTHCFVCQKEQCAMNEEELTRCDKKYTNSANSRCNTRFHMSCLKEYNAGDYDVFYLQELHKLQKQQKQMICPLHHCDLCYFERMKNTAVKGEFIQCKCCYRSFHKECRPAGANVEMEKVKLTVEGTDQVMTVGIQKTVCHAHPFIPYNKLNKKFNQRAHTSFCCECEEFGNKENLISCSQCIKSFHSTCLMIKEIKGHRYSANKPLCEGCIIGESIRIGIPVICRFQNSFYPGVSVALEKYPKHCASVDKFGKYLNKPGFVAVEWGGCQNLFSLIPVQSVMHMFNGSFRMIGKRMSDNDHKNAWERMEKEIIVPRPVFEDDNVAYTQIKTSVYHPECMKPRLINQYLENVMCDCPASDPNRCSEGSNCANRASTQECPEKCDERGRGCNNRDISRRRHHPSIDVVKTDGKGYGVIALDDIPKGAFIAEYAGELISPEEKNRRIEIVSRSRNDEEKHYMMQLDTRRVIDCKRKGNIARFLNHSCEPNCKVDTIDIVVYTSSGNQPIVRYDKRTRISALKEIKKGEELCFNYNMEEYNAGCPLPECKCGSENCTGKLGMTVEDRQAQKHRRLGEDSRRTGSLNESANSTNSRLMGFSRKRKGTVSNDDEEETRDVMERNVKKKKDK